MDSLPMNCILKFKPDTLNFLRKQYGFDTVKRVNDAIDVLEEWIAKQEHFEKKKFDRGYLERLLINNKGSVEKSKKKLDKLCTLRTLIPEFFAIEPIDKELIFATYYGAILTHMTPEYGRIHLQQNVGQTFDTEAFVNYSRYVILTCKYLQIKDYCNHITFINDYRYMNMLEFMKCLDWSVIRKTCEIGLEGFSMRINAVHFITESKAMETMLALLKPLIGEKLSGRIHVHRNIESLCSFIPKELLPQDFGGNDKSLTQLREDLYEEIYSPKFTEYRREMSEACTNEALRRKDKFNEEYLGVSGTFRTLTVD